MGVSIRAYARGRGCTEGAVRKAIAARRITPNPDGTIDPARANQEWDRNTFAGKTLHQAASPKVVTPPPSRGGLPSVVQDYDWTSYGLAPVQRESVAGAE